MSETNKMTTGFLVCPGHPAGAPGIFTVAELRVGPYRDAKGLWAIVKCHDGRRMIVDVSPESLVLRHPVLRG